MATVYIRMTVSLSSPKTVQLQTTGFSGVVKWTDVDSISYTNVSNPTFAYVNAGVYTIELQNITEFSTFNGAGDMTDFEYVTQIATWTNMEMVFSGKVKLASATFRANSSGNVASMQNLFNNCSALTSVTFEENTTTALTNVSNMFYGCNIFNQELSAHFDMKLVTNASNMFNSCSSYNKPLPNPSAPTISLINVSSMFRGCTSYNKALPDNFDMRSVINAEYMFLYCTAYNQLLPNPSAPTTSLLHVNAMFSMCSAYNKPLPANFDMRSVIATQGMFYNCIAYNCSLPNPGAPTTALTNVENMFSMCSVYNQPLPANFDMRSVTNCRSMFYNCIAYNCSLPNPSARTTALTDTSLMFRGCTSYNKPLPANFDMVSVTEAATMFFNCIAYNCSLPNPSAPTIALFDVSNMFYGCSSYNKPLPANFNMQSVRYASAMLSNCGMSATNYSQFLENVANTSNLQSNVQIGAHGLQYFSSAIPSRTFLTTTKNWMITGDSLQVATINNICFLAGTPVVVDDVGTIPIERIVPGKHTIRGKAVAHITETISTEDKLVCIDKHALGHNTPSRDIVVSLHHKVLHEGKMVEAVTLVGAVSGVYTRKYRGEVLYNVLLADNVHGTMDVCGLTCETLDPTNSVAKLYQICSQLTVKQCSELIQRLNAKILAEKSSSALLVDGV